MNKRYVKWTDENGEHHSGEFLCVHSVVSMEIPVKAPLKSDPLTITMSWGIVSATAYVIERNKVIEVPATWLNFVGE